MSLSIGSIVNNVVSHVTGSEQLGTLIGAGLDYHMGNGDAAAAQLRTADLGGGGLFAKLLTDLGYDFAAGGYGTATGQRADFASVLEENRQLDELYAQANDSGDWSEVVDYEMSLSEYEEIDADEAELQETLDEGLALLDETSDLDDLDDFIEYESEEQAASDGQYGELKV